MIKILRFYKGFTVNSFEIVLVKCFPKNGLRIIVGANALETFFFWQLKNWLLTKNGLRIDVRALANIFFPTTEKQIDYFPKMVLESL